MKMKTQHTKLMGYSKGSYKREELATVLTLRKILNNLTLYLKELGKEEQTKTKVSRRKEIIKIKANRSKIKQRLGKQ